MNLFQKGELKAGKLYRLSRRWVTMMMTIVMIAMSLMPNFILASMASTELPNINLGDKGASEGTAWGVSERGFDLCGLEAGQTEYSKSGIQTTYQWKGYGTYIRVGGSGNKIKVDMPYSGAVGTLAAENLEYRLVLSPSPDNKYIFLDYYIYDKSGTTRRVQLGTGADVMIGGSKADDSATVYKNERGFHMVNQYVQTTFDCITNDSSLGVTPPDTRWIGHYQQWIIELFNESPEDVLTGVDSGIAYSWDFQLRPYETVHRRVAFAIRDTSYYVSNSGNDDGTADGTYSKPFKTIEYAQNKIGNKKGYIYIMDSMVLSAPIRIKSGQDITIASSDFDHAGNPSVGKPDYIKTLSRAGSYDGSMCVADSGGTLRFTDIVLEGDSKNSPEPLLMVSQGTLELNSGTVVQNSKITASDKGSAVEVSGSANITMNMSEIKGNVSSGGGAVNFKSSGIFKVVNQVQIETNTDTAGNKANVFLDDRKTITVSGDLDTSKIGVTTKQRPTESPGGVSTQASQEVVVAVPESGSAVDTAPSPFVNNFFTDKEGDGLFIDGGTKNLTGAGANHDRNTVLKRNGYTINFIRKDADTGGEMIGAAPIPSVTAAGDAVDIPALPEPAGYKLTGIIIDQGTIPLLSANMTQGADYGKITGTMPNQDVTVEYEYRKQMSTIAFEANGGTPKPPTLSGAVGSTVNAMLPNISRYGYKFRGWSRNADWQNPDFITALPDVYGLAPITYYAVYEPDPNITFNYTVDYSNQAGDITFQSVTRENAYSVESPVQEQKKNIHGYVWSHPNSGTTPSEYNYSGTVQPVGAFDVGTGAFAGKMPGQDLAVRYRYQVDATNPAARSQLEVRHVTEAGTVVSPVQRTNHYPEEAITASAVVRYGYECVGARIDSGNVADDTDGNLVNALKGNFDGSFWFTGTMPNQPVVLTYTYEPTQEGYPLTVKYLDEDTTDNRSGNIIQPLIRYYQADDPVGTASPQSGMEYIEPYGYSLLSKTMSPATPLISWSGNDFTGTMPNDSVDIEYKHKRQPALWSDITYRAGTNGTLTAGGGMSSDVSDLGDGSFKTSVLKNDGTVQGEKKAYNLAQMKEKSLIPEAVPSSEYYRFGGWFMDTNLNGTLDNGETLLEEETQFSAASVLTAHFEEVPEKWIDIHFKAGENGTINVGEPLSLHTTYDKTWGDIRDNLPEHMPELNYLEEGWYDGENLMKDDMALINGKTYTIQFYADPEIFGTDVAAPQAVPGLNGQGKGKITVYNTTAGYKYILTDQEGRVLYVVRGKRLSARLMFDNLYPGARYKVYEATGNTTISAGNLISDMTGVVSIPTEVLTPVVETNYQVYYDDEDEGKTTLVIRPADQDSDYAILDRDGNVVVTPETSDGGWQSSDGTPASINYTGLNYNREYTVVARPKGHTEITAESRLEDGSVITTDPGGELELPSYIVEAINGRIEEVGEESVGASRYEEARKGDLVKLRANEVNEDGERFSHWNFTIGSVKSLGSIITQRELSFTMPDTNLVLTAVYNRPVASPGKVMLTDEVRGGNGEELALDPKKIPELEDELTTNADRDLMDINGADVTYKVVYRKNTAKTSEAEAIKASGNYDRAHEKAFKTAWGLDVSLERYVNGRKLEMASPSNAEFGTYVQLEKEDVDMMDYQLYELVENPDDGTLEANLVTIDYDPDETGGLYTFKANDGGRYVMVFNRAYRLHFLNNVALPIEKRYRYNFKVRRDEAPGDPYYSDKYGELEEQLDYFVNSEGVEYRYGGWSYHPDKMREFDPEKKITRKSYVYAYYTNNQNEMGDVRKELEEAIKEAIELRDDHFLKKEESQKVEEAIAKALEVLDQENPMAIAGDLQEAIKELKENTEPYVRILKERYERYNNIQDGGNKGGSSGGGGSGSGTKKNPYNLNKPKNYEVGTNGNWVEVEVLEGQERQMSFVLNGGKPLSSMWANLEYPEGDEALDGWYHFNSKGIMDTGWFRDEKDNWYYCNTEKEGQFGKMVTGWHSDSSDGNRYYLDQQTGEMAIGWKQIEGIWYYFEMMGSGAYLYDSKQEKWAFSGGDGDPLGAMYKNKMTPDGYWVNADGVWVQ